MKNLFGEDLAPTPTKQKTNHKAVKGHFLLTQIHGTSKGNKCKDCVFLTCHHQAKKWYKCAKVKGGGEQTDWRVGWQACGLFQPEPPTEVVSTEGDFLDMFDKQNQHLVKSHQTQTPGLSHKAVTGQSQPQPKSVQDFALALIEIKSKNPNADLKSEFAQMVGMKPVPTKPDLLDKAYKFWKQWGKVSELIDYHFTSIK